MAEQKNCWLGINGKKFGPMSEQDIVDMYHKKKIAGNVMFFRLGAKEWVTLDQSGLIGPVIDDDGVPPLPEETEPPMMEEKRVLRNIDKFNCTKEYKCLLCGYKGQMGVVRNKTNTFLALILTAIAAVILYVVFYVVFCEIMNFVGHFNAQLMPTFSILILLSVLSAAISIFRDLTRKKVLFCPNCEKEIVEK